MRNKRNIVLTATPEKISYNALVEALANKIKNSGELIEFDNFDGLKAAIQAAEKKGN